MEKPCGVLWLWLRLREKCSNAAYLKMLAQHDDASARKLRAAYLAYTSEEIDCYAALHKQVLGYEPPQIMLPHNSRLNANNAANMDNTDNMDNMKQLLQLFKRKGYTFVSLPDAERNPACQSPDTLIPKYGMMWGYRWTHERGIKINGNLEKKPPGWIEQYGRNALRTCLKTTGKTPK